MIDFKIKVLIEIQMYSLIENKNDIDCPCKQIE